MKKILAILLLCTLSANAQTLYHKISTNATVTIPIYYAATPWIVFSTPTTAQLSCSLIKPDNTIKYFNVAATGNYRLATSTKGNKWIGIGIPAADFDTLGAYALVVNASFSHQWARSIFVQSADGKYELANGVGAKIASVTADITAARDTIGGWIANVTATAGDVIPASGTTLPRFSASWDGDISRPYLMGFAFSRTEAEPEFICRIVQDDGAGIPLIYESDFTHAVFPYSVAILGATAYVHGWTANIAGIPRNMQFSVLCSVENNGRAIAGTSKLVLNPTPEVVMPDSFDTDISNLFTTLQSVRLSNDPHEIYIAPYGLSRATPGESSVNSRHVPAGGVYAIVVRAENLHSGLIEEVTQVVDHDSITNSRGPFYTIPSTLQAQMAIDGVTMVIKAGKEEGIE